MIAALAIAAALTAADFGVDPKASVPLAPWTPPAAGSCHLRTSHGMALPDPRCTPGAVNPTITAKVLRDPRFRTGLVRDDLTSAAAKRQVYAWYAITPPADNRGPGQMCELDHLISLGLGGSDALANVWPQCGPAGVPVGRRWFKVKDAHAELGLMRQVKAGADLGEIQHRIAADWTQFVGP